MAIPRSKLITALELYWNRCWVFDDRIKLIICGSATSWIIENIINNKGGLHNRVTRSLLFDRPDQAITICEIKYSDSLFAIDKVYAQNLLKKMEVFRKHTKLKKQILLSMVTIFGLKETMYSEEIVTNQVTLENLFKEM